MNEYIFHSLTHENQQDAYRIYQQNKNYFALTGDSPSKEQPMRDRDTIPPKIGQDQKVFSVIYYKGQPIAVMDYLLGYPQEATVYIGLLLVSERRNGHGRSIYQKVEQEWQSKGFSLVSLAVLEENSEGCAFWQSQGFKEVGKTVTAVNNQEASVIKFEKRIGNF